MRKKFSLLVSALVLLCGCGNVNGPETPEISLESKALSVPASSVDTSKSTIGSNKSTASSRKSTASSEAPTVPNAESSAINFVPTEISDYINTLDNGDLVFVNYKFTEAPAVITDKNELGEVYEKALAVLKDTEEYKYFSENFSLDDPRGFFLKKPEEFLSNGVPTPVFKSAFTDDLDRDSKNESFVLISIPIQMNDVEYRWGEREFLICVGDGTDIISDYYGAEFKAVLDYGLCKQIIVRSEGWNGNDRLSNIWGVLGGEAQKLYGGRLDFEKSDCFLYSTGPQTIGDFAVYDIEKHEYLAIQGKQLSADLIKAMDTDGTLKKEIVSAVLIGGKYYIINRTGIYTYEDGGFKSSEARVRSSLTPGYTGEALNTIADIDYYKAISAMITPEEAKKLN